MCAQDATPWSTGTAGTYYFFDEPIAALGREYRCGVLADTAPGANPLGVVIAPGGGMNVRVLAGQFRQVSIDTLFVGGDVALTAADPNYPRIDYVSIWLDPDDVTPHLAVMAGIPDNSMPMPLLPLPQHRGAGITDCVLAIVIVYAGMTEVLEEHIYDRRFFLPFVFTGSSNKLATATLAIAAVPAGNLVTWNVDRNIVNSGRALTTVGDLSGPAAAVDGEVALYDGVTGKLLKRGTGTGITRVAAGVQSAAELSGDVTTSGSNAVTIANNAVTYAKQQDVSAASRLLGRGAAAGAGDSEEITLGANLTMTGTTLAASGGSGAPVASAQGEYNTNSTEQTLLSYTIPGGTLGTAGGVLWYLTGRILANSGTNNWTLRIKLGATTLLGDVSATITNGATRRALTLWGMVFNNGSASVQLGTVEGQIGALTAGSIAGNMDIAVATTATFALVAGQGSGSEDTTTDKVFAVTGQFSVSNVAVEFTWKAVAYLI